MNARIHTTNPRYAQRLWHELGGTIRLVRGTGEIRFLHPTFPSSVRANGRRSDVPAVLLCRINKLLTTRAATTQIACVVKTATSPR